MNENPYKSPQADSAAVADPNRNRSDLRSIAQYQRNLAICILVYITAALAQLVVPMERRFTPAIAAIGAIIAGAVFVVLLAMKVYGTGLGIVLGVISLIPCIGLVVLLIVNQKAITVLRQSGIEVGFMGTNRSSI